MASLVAFVVGILCAPLPDLQAETATIERVVDGDTLIVRVDGKSERARLIGVDTPESALNERAKRLSREKRIDLNVMIDQGLRAKAFVKSRISEGTAVRLEFDVRPRDDYGRLLVYVFLPDGEMLNALVVREGFAYPLTVPPNVRYKDRFLSLFREAREGGRGLWAGG